MKFIKSILLLSVTLMLFSCSSDSGGGAQGGSGEVPGVLTYDPNAPQTDQKNLKETAATAQTSEASGTRTDKGTYHGRTNGGRPTWYFPKNMSSYPSTFTVKIPNCSSFQVVNNNGKRFEQGLYIVKQSHVSGRGLALLAPSKCGSRTALITY
ncbi:MAG: hypothetical protein KJO28_03530 [Desulfofustis sp.]|nr:hypothetical protein [Desulfofustis sp.]